MELRDYQKEMCARVNAALVDYRSIMVQMPTGTGKTVVLASVVENLIGVNVIQVFNDRFKGLLALMSRTID